MLPLERIWVRTVLAELVRLRAVQLCWLETVLLWLRVQLWFHQWLRAAVLLLWLSARLMMFQTLLLWLLDRVAFLLCWWIKCW